DATWAYDLTAGGSQVISVITVSTLIENAVANGDTPNLQQGYHFKLQFSQDPQKHKTFWVECTPAGEQLPLDCDGDTDGSVLVNGVCDGTPPARAVQAASTAPSLPHAGSGPGTSPMLPLAVMAAVALAVGGGLLLVLHLGRRQRI
ncbi:MAG: hypothetical protein M3O87_07845, partial [Candidatus Dormibacteraeota bacterium]|nr:hypothetical protein [Candidatus Dormibacteraeota bacterium]